MLLYCINTRQANKRLPENVLKKPIVVVKLEKANALEMQAMTFN
jgi:hypothetical protein